MAGDVTRTVRIVYEVDGVEEATTAQGNLGDACEDAGRKLAAQGDIARESEQVYQRQQQALNDLTGAMQTAASILGSESEAGALVGRMAQGAQMGRQLGAALGMIPGPVGAMLGPMAALAGTLTGGLIPAIGAMFDALTPVVPAIREVTTEAQSSTDAVLDMGDAFSGAADRMREFIDGVSTAGRARGLESLNAQITEISDRLADINTTGGSAMDRLDAMSERGRLSEQLASLTAQSASVQEQLDAEGRETGSGRRRGGRGGRGGSRGGADRGFDDAVRFASGLGGAEDGRPSEFDVMGADLQRQQRNRGFGGGRGGDQVQAQIASLEQIKDKQQEIHDAQMQRIEQQVEAWTGAGQKIGSTLYNAFQTAATGQESLDVAVVKGFTGLAIQFGGQMVNEGIAALLTAAGNTVANPPMAATKAAEGAGKLALGIGLGAAGAAIPVPSSGAQARTPRLGPAEDSSRGGGSTIVNMNAPSVVTGSGSQVGRLIGRSLDDARQRFGRAA